MSLDKTFDGSDAHLLPADADECVALLCQFNEWRRFDGEIDEEGPAMPHPKTIGFAIDMAIQLIEQHGELLAALESLVDMDVSYGRGEKVEDAVENAKSAIARAKGGA